MDEINYTGQKISGTTLINHSVRVKLNLTCDEYALLDFLEQMQHKHIDITYELIFRKIGITRDVYDAIVKKFSDDDMIRYNIEKDRVYIRVSKRFRESFYVSEQEFEEFWIENKKVAWPGSKTDALQKYIAARKCYSHDYLMKQRYWYFKVLGLPNYSYRSKMMASVFLNMKTKRFEEDWEEQYHTLTGTEKPKQPIATITKTDKNQLFNS